jgi:hypothetical protein
VCDGVGLDNGSFVEWRAGMPNAGRLPGTIRTLDMAKGEVTLDCDELVPAKKFGRCVCLRRAHVRLSLTLLCESFSEARSCAPLALSRAQGGLWWTTLCGLASTVTRSGLGYWTHRRCRPL